MKNKVIISIIIVIVLAGVGFLIFKNKSAANNNSNIPAQTFTMAEVSQHFNQTSCYTVINGLVYDITGYINQHPGGPDKVLAICGQDGTQAFSMKHSGDGRAASALSQFIIGKLKV